MEDLVEDFERLYVEFDELTEEVEAALQDLLWPDVVVHDVTSNVLHKQKYKAFSIIRILL